MRSRITTILTMVLLVAGTGGAIAIGEGSSPGGPGGGAAIAQYKPGKGCGDKNHKHKRSAQCKAPKKHKASKHKATKKSKSKKGGNTLSNCTIRVKNGLTVLYCP